MLQCIDCSLTPYDFQTLDNLLDSDISFFEIFEENKGCFVLMLTHTYQELQQHNHRYNTLSAQTDYT